MNRLNETFNETKVRLRLRMICTAYCFLLWERRTSIPNLVIWRRYVSPKVSTKSVNLMSFYRINYILLSVKLLVCFVLLFIVIVVVSKCWKLFCYFDIKRKDKKKTFHLISPNRQHTIRSFRIVEINIINSSVNFNFVLPFASVAHLNFMFHIPHVHWRSDYKFH